MTEIGFLLFLSRDRLLAVRKMLTLVSQGPGKGADLCELACVRASSCTGGRACVRGVCACAGRRDLRLPLALWRERLVLAAARQRVRCLACVRVRPARGS